MACSIFWVVILIWMQDHPQCHHPTTLLHEGHAEFLCLALPIPPYMLMLSNSSTNSHEPFIMPNNISSEWGILSSLVMYSSIGRHPVGGGGGTQRTHIIQWDLGSCRYEKHLRQNNMRWILRPRNDTQRARESQDVSPPVLAYRRSQYKFFSHNNYMTISGNSYCTDIRQDILTSQSISWTTDIDLLGIYQI